MTSSAHLEPVPAAPRTGALTVQELRLWCAPEVILAVTDLDDEETVLFHAVRQARCSAAKVLLAHVLPGSRSSLPPSRLAVARNAASVERAQQTLDRMTRKLRWVGISCEPVLLRGEAAEEILVLAKMRSANRVLLTAWRDRSPLARTLAEEIAPWVGVPVCVVPAGLPRTAAAESGTARVVLALSLRSDWETPLAFACRLAQHTRAVLTVVHVFGKEADRTSTSIASRLPAGALREAGLLCPLEIVACSGDATAEILKIAAVTQPDYLLLGMPRSPYPDQTGVASIASAIVNQARCPVMLLGRRAAQLYPPDAPPSASIPA